MLKDDPRRCLACVEGSDEELPALSGITGIERHSGNQVKVQVLGALVRASVGDDLVVGVRKASVPDDAGHEVEQIGEQGDILDLDELADVPLGNNHDVSLPRWIRMLKSQYAFALSDNAYRDLPTQDGVAIEIIVHREGEGMPQRLSATEPGYRGEFEIRRSPDIVAAAPY